MIKKYTSLKLTILCMLVFFCFNSNGYGQTPASDCTTVTATAQLTVGATCSTVTWNSTNNTDYWNNAALGACIFAADRDDAWGWFTATSISTTVTYTSTNDAIVTLFTGACSPTMTDLACADNTTTGSETITYPTVIGTIYMIRIQRYNSDANMNGTICVFGTGSGLANDDCIGAINLPVNATCTYATYSNATATASTGVPAPTCANYLGGDVWFSTIVPAGGAIIVNTQAGVMTDSGMAIYSGSCAGLTQIACNDDSIGLMSSITATGLTPGQTIYIRVWEYGNNNNGTFGICVTTPPPAPPNDLCANATALPCGTSNLAGTTNSTSNTPTTAGCSMSNYGVWYTFVGDGQQSTIVVNATFDSEIAIASGSCGALTNLSCTDAGNPETVAFVTTLGVTYYVYVSHWLAGSATTGNFTISRTCNPVTVPPNDLCANAINLPCGTSNLAGTTNFTTNVAPTIGCSMGSYGVWYTFLGDGQDTNISVNATYDIELGIASGTCATLTNLGCVDAGNPETFAFTTVVGVRYYVYIASWLAGSSTTGNFTISRTCTPPCVLPPIVTTPTCGVVAGGLGLSGADPAPITSCVGTGCVDIEANYLNLGNTTSYRVEKIPYNPPATGALFPIAGLTDDTFSATIGLPWQFCFYGTQYNQFVYGANSVITFNTALAGMASGWDINYNVPAAINAEDFGTNYFYGPSIYGVHHDIDPGVFSPPATMQIGRRIDNTPGCERMIIVWEDVPMFSNNSVLYSGKMVLYRNSNVIEIYIAQKNVVASWNDGNASVAIQNNATTGLAAPCRNSLDTNWTVTNEAWRFVPNAGDIAELRWLENGVPMAASTNNQDVLNVCPTSTTTYTAQVTYTPACGTPWTISDDTIVTVGDKIWNGSVNTNWFVNNNWTPSGRPTALDCVIIPNVTTSNNRSPIADIAAPGGTTALARNLTIRANGSLQVNANTFLQVTDAVTVNPAAGPLPAGDLLIRDTGSLVQITDVAANNNSGPIRMQRTVPGGVGLQNYVHWSAPVEGFDVGNINMAPTEPRWEWNPTQSGLNGTWTGASGAMTVGKGYIVRGLVPSAPIPVNSAEFVGRPSNGIINTPINRGTWTGGTYTAVGGGSTMATNIDDNWNLVGNPYPSAISASAFITANTLAPTPKIDGTIYLWSHAGLPSGNTTQDPFYGNYVYNYLGSDYLASNGVGSTPPGFLGNIASGQSFFVQMLDGAGLSNTVAFNNSMRSSALANNNFLRTGERHRIWLDLIAPTEVASSTLIGYLTDATNDRDILYDGYDLSDASLQFYSLIGTKEMTIQGRAFPFEQEDRVPLGAVISQNGNYKIAINQLDGIFSDSSQGIYIEDTYMNSINDLRTAPYTFTSESGTFNDRFILRYTNQTLSTPQQVANFGFNIIGLKDYIKVSSGNSPINTVVVYDVLGRVLADYKDVNALEFKLDFVNQSKGTLIVKATLYNGQQKIKKVIY